MKMSKTLAVLAALLLAAAGAQAGTAFLTGEVESGMHKICYYDHMGDTVAITIRWSKLCPLTIRV